MKEKNSKATSEMAFRLWMFACVVKELKRNPNEQKTKKLKSRMEAFQAVVAKKGTAEDMASLKALIEKL